MADERDPAQGPPVASPRSGMAAAALTLPDSISGDLVSHAAAGTSPEFDLPGLNPPPPRAAEPPVAGADGYGVGPGPPASGAAQPATGITHATRAQRLALIAGVLVVGGLALELFASVLTPFVAAAVLAYALDPPTTRLTRMGLSRGAAALVMMLALIAGVLLFALLLYPLLLLQIKLLATRIPQYAFLLQGWASDQLAHLQDNFGSDVVNDKLRDLVSSQAASMLSILLSTATGVVTSGFAIFNVLTLAIVTPVLGFYFLRDWPKTIRMVTAWVPRRYSDVIAAQAREVDRILSAWVRGQAMCCLILAFYYAVGLTAAGLDLGLIVGLAAGVLSFIPYVGSVTGGMTAIGLALAQFPDWRHVGVVIGILIVGQILEGYVIYPRFLGDRVELPAVWVIFALFAAGAAFGFVGVMLAVPVAATIGVLARFWLRRYLASPLYLDPPAATSTSMPLGVD
jgi:predicted PurR-regulated permease PerM